MSLKVSLKLKSEIQWNKESILHFLMIISIRTGPTFLQLWQCNRQWESEAFHIARLFFIICFLFLFFVFFAVYKGEGNGTE